MATPTDQTERARHPERFARPDDQDTMRIWTGIGAPPNDYGWGKNRAHGTSTPLTPNPLRPSETVDRGPEIVEFIPEPQDQLDPWSLTDPHLAKTEVTRPVAPTEAAPRGRLLDEPEAAIPQPQRYPWSLTPTRPVEARDGQLMRPTGVDPEAPAVGEIEPVPQPQRDPWSLTATRTLPPQVRDVRQPEWYEEAPSVGEIEPVPQPQRDPWELTRTSRGSAANGSTAVGVPKTR
jgi:hypothetical protein